MYTCFDIANYFLFKATEGEGGELISNLKLQKLVYYAQGLYLTCFKQPLFKECIEAWTYGPVIPDLYQKYKEYGKSGIPAEDNFNPGMITEKDREFLDEIFDVFGQFSAIRLKDIAHEDECWRQAYDRCPGSIITYEAMTEDLVKYMRNG
ncbi:MAG: SocA family protein [Nitrospirae bacterium]|nr:SocA family protein [Nitrospirota bacterium]